ncbi:LacI family DNA-binding transcriptional regulator [Fulvivirga sp. M361]|uniref:LacI family DNA-binding transcriptional regulator n=1 Tax=Fulvivirga sp. M361 TaxID=2594266 RepID=UPI001624AC7E|nr:LacI family DNA-binding transcriptional regulator [Fulvivirga sp. M361]
MATTIKDIAHALGCSPSTVSRALHDHPQINEDTKKAIRQMAKKMNFQINQVAAGLRKHKTFCIGVIVPSISNYFFSATLSGIQDAASKRQYQVLVCQTNESVVEEERYARALSAGRVDGILLSVSMDSQKHEHLTDLLSQKIPLVLFDRTMDKLDVFKVEAEDYEGSVRVTEHMIKKGCKKIAYLAGPESLINNSRNRLAGYCDALKNNGMAFDKSLMRVCDFDKEKAREAVKELMSQYSDIDGIYAVNDELAVEAILTLKSLGIAVPGQVCVSGFGNYPIAEIVEPQLTTIGHNPYLIGYKAAERIMGEIHRDVSLGNDPRIELVKSSLIERGSTAR